MVYGILVPHPGIETRPLSVKAWSSNPWTGREFLLILVLRSIIPLMYNHFI